MPKTEIIYPEELLSKTPLIWWNENRNSRAEGGDVGERDILDARSRWQKFAPLIEVLFPQTAEMNGYIDSPLTGLEQAVADKLGASALPVLVKADHLLPLTGSIKARGGVYEVLLHAEAVARQHNLLGHGQSYAVLAGPGAREVYGSLRIAVGSTGNLGYSVGIIANALGFQVDVHMSRDAKSWKKERLRKIGVNVVEHEGDYSVAVETARSAAQADENCYFIDDENSLPLFLGYAAAAQDLKTQLDEAGIAASEALPVDVFLPCGVGGAPGGITFGIKQLYGNAVRCIWVEPTASPCMLVQLIAGDKPTSVYEIGLDNNTAADGLAVPAASMLVHGLSGPLVDAVATVSDDAMIDACRIAWKEAGMRLEPSAAAGFAALGRYYEGAESRGMVKPGAVVVWTTGGGHLPDEEFHLIVGSEKQ